MCPTRLCWLLPAALFSTFFATARSADLPQVVRLRADHWMPYNGEPAEVRPGYAIELARAIFSAQGCTVDYQTLPWADALKAAAAGEIEGVIGASQKEAKLLTVPHEPIGEPTVGLYVRRESTWKFDRMTSLMQVKLGVIEGYSYWDSLDAYINNRPPPQVTLLRGATPLLDGIGMLERGELDVVAEIQPVWLWSIKSSGRSNRDFRSVYLQPGEPIYIAFASPHGAKLAKIFDEGIARMRANGELAAILDKYSVSDWK